MADITALKNSNTFEEQMTTINSIITKLNTIEANATTLTLDLLSTEPATVALNTAVLFVDTDGDFKIKINDDGTTATYTVTIEAD
jgi:hypothetical protein